MGDQAQSQQLQPACEVLEAELNLCMRPNDGTMLNLVHIQVCWKSIGLTWHSCQAVAGATTALSHADAAVSEDGTLWIATWQEGKATVTIQHFQGDPTASSNQGVQ